MTFLNIFSKKKEKTKEKNKILVDHREKNSLIPSLLANKFQVEFQQLPVADYLINNIAIERKTIPDLKSSIINKRIFSQLLEIKQYPSFFLIIEGPQEELYDNYLVSENAIRGFLLAVITQHKVPIIYSENQEDTANYLTILANKKDKPLSLRPSKTLKTKEEQIQFILEGFPNIGPTKAKALLSHFKSLKNIINADEEDLSKILGKRAKDFKELID